MKSGAARLLQARNQKEKGNSSWYGARLAPIIRTTARPRNASIPGSRTAEVTGATNTVSVAAAWENDATSGDH
jgi:hypothetical protein